MRNAITYFLGALGRQPDRVTAGLAALGCLSLLSACGETRGDPPVRLAQTIPEERLASDSGDLREHFRWRFDQETDLDPWQLRADVDLRLDDGALWMASSDRSSAVRGVDLAATDIDVILVQLDGLRRGQTRLFWSGPRERFHRDRSIALTLRDGVEGFYEFRVGDHPGWTGRIRRLRFDATTEPSERVALASIAGLTYRAPQRLPLDNHRIELDHELRAGLAVTPTQPQTRSLDVSTQARLYFAFGLLLPPRAGEARFSITTVIRGHEEEIFAQSIPGGAPRARAWQPAAVDLDGKGAETVELRFGISCVNDNCMGAFGSVEARSNPPQDRPNVLLISIDTLRADRMSLYGNPTPTTPWIDQWAETDGVTFEKAVVQAPWTLPSHVSMLTGLDAVSHGVNHNSPAPPELETLAERLRPLGYFTAAVTGGGYMDPRFGFWQGFDLYRYWPDGPSRSDVTHGVDDTLELLEEIDGRPFFLLFHTYEVHDPFHARQPYFQRFWGEGDGRTRLSAVQRRLPVTEQPPFADVRKPAWRRPGGQLDDIDQADLPMLHALYDSGLAFTDAQLGRLFERLETLALLDSTIVIFTSDHGELLGEEGLGGHGYLDDPNLLVPLVFSWPAGFEGGHRVTTQVRSVDIVPTLLELVGAGIADGLDGVSLVPFLRGQPLPIVPPAQTYAASSNYGLSLRVSDRFQYRYNDTPWRSGLDEQLVMLRRDGSDRPLPESPSLRRRAEELLESRRGLHLQLINDAGPADLLVQLEGPIVNPRKIKATGLQCECARWLGGSTAELQMPQGHQIKVQFEDVQGGTLRLRLISATVTEEAEVDVGSITAPVTIGWNRDGQFGSGWPDDTLQRGARLYWLGARRLVEDEPDERDLLEQLRALGYVR